MSTSRRAEQARSRTSTRRSSCHRPRHGSTSAPGSNVARDVAWIRAIPIPRMMTDRSTVTATVRRRHDLSTGHTHDTSLAPFAAANRAASCVGDPRAPNGRNVTGAAASAAASAAPAAFVYAPTAAPTAATATIIVSTKPMSAAPTTIDPDSLAGAVTVRPASMLSRPGPQGTLRTTAPQHCGGARS